MKFFPALVLIVAVLALGIMGILESKILLGVMSKSLVVVILAAAGFALVWAAIRFNSRLAAGTPRE
jgi:hypothetical protein